VTGRILIVEDHATMREAMRMILEGDGFEVDEASDGPSALAAIRRDPPDLVLLDLHIPGADGPGVLDELKGDPRTAEVRVLVVTATGEEGRADALAHGADDYFIKPFSPAALLSTVARMLDRPQDAEAPEAP